MAELSRCRGQGGEQRRVGCILHQIEAIELACGLEARRSCPAGQPYTMERLCYMAAVCPCRMWRLQYIGRSSMQLQRASWLVGRCEMGLERKKASCS